MSKAQSTHTGADYSINLADRLAISLRKSGVSVQEMAEAIGVNRNTIGNYLSERSRPTKLAIREWGMRTGYSPKWLETGIEPTDPENRPQVTLRYLAPVTQLRPAA